MMQNGRITHKMKGIQIYLECNNPIPSIYHPLPYLYKNIDIDHKPFL